MIRTRLTFNNIQGHKVEVESTVESSGQDPTQVSETNHQPFGGEGDDMEDDDRDPSWEERFGGEDGPEHGDESEDGEDSEDEPVEWDDDGDSDDDNDWDSIDNGDDDGDRDDNGDRDDDGDDDGDRDDDGDDDGDRDDGDRDDGEDPGHGEGDGVYQTNAYNRFRHPMLFTSDEMRKLIRITKPEFVEFCRLTAPASPNRTVLSHEARAFLYRLRVSQNFSKDVLGVLFRVSPKAAMKSYDDVLWFLFMHDSNIPAAWNDPEITDIEVEGFLTRLGNEQSHGVR